MTPRIGLKRLAAAVAATSLACMLAAPARSQTTAAAEAGETGGLAEVIVTA